MDQSLLNTLYMVYSIQRLDLCSGLSAHQLKGYNVPQSLVYHFICPNEIIALYSITVRSSVYEYNGLHRRGKRKQEGQRHSTYMCIGIKISHTFVTSLKLLQSI